MSTRKFSLRLATPIAVVALLVGTLVIATSGSDAIGDPSLTERLASSKQVAQLSNGRGYWLVPPRAP